MILITFNANCSKIISGHVIQPTSGISGYLPQTGGYNANQGGVLPYGGGQAGYPSGYPG